jgi:signal transduction histidine kinase
VRDITDKVRLEEEIRTTQARLIHTNKMASLGLLVSSISHEVNNPNNYISVNAQTLTDVWRDAAPLLEERRQERGDFPLAGIPAGEMIPLTERLISGIAEGSRRISAIVGTMRDYVKTDASYIRSGFSLNRLIDNALAILWHLVRKNTDHLHLELAPDLPPLHGNPQQIEQVVMNLVVNALQALPDRSRGVVITTSLEREQEAIILTVSDEGQGMERHTLEHLAEPFFTTKGDRGGTGLGLYISRSILKEHGGTLSFESAPGKGTTVTVTLPLRRCDEKEGSAPLPPPLN